MSSAATIAEHIHGLPIREGAVDQVCGYSHEPSRTVDTERYDPGLRRRSRLADYVFTLRRENRDDQADAIEQQL